MSSLLAKCQTPNAEGRIQHVTPENAGWRYVGFDVYRLTAGQWLPVSPPSPRCAPNTRISVNA
jgi:5-deoxy-D-glucuronate isomerase